MSKFTVVAVVAYLLCMAAIVWGMRAAQRAAVREYGTESAAEQWQEWRRDASRQSEGDGPVKRRAPKSERPPAIMLMTEYFGTCLTLALVLSSILFGTIVAMVHGAYRRPASVDEL